MHFFTTFPLQKYNVLPNHPKKLMILFLFPTALSFKEKKMTKAPLPDSVRIGQVSLAVFQIAIFSLKSNFFHFWAKNRISRVKLLEICLISSAKFISCSRILPCGTNFFITFAVWLSLYASIERLWSSVFIFQRN